MRRADLLVLVVFSLALAGCGYSGTPGQQAKSGVTQPRSTRIIFTGKAEAPPKSAKITSADTKQAKAPPRTTKMASPASAKPMAALGETEPKPWSGVVLRLEFVDVEQRRVSGGTAFFIKGRSDQHYLLTCAHLIEEKKWRDLAGLNMHTMDNVKHIELFGPSLKKFVGSAVNLDKRSLGGLPDLTRDLVIQEFPDARWAKPLPLAAADPKLDDQVWVVGCEYGRPPSNENLYPGRIVRVSEGGYVLEKGVAFNPRGFSGGPVVNRKGEVVGNVLAATDRVILGATVSTLRKKLKENGISLE